MKILAVNGSPRGKNGNTDRILQSFLQGAQEAGAEVETIYLKDLKINSCIGCFTCWTKTPGVCIHRDDMVWVLPKIREADIVVYATPLYVFTVSGLMKNFMDRLLPNVNPHIVKRGGHYIHPPRHPVGKPQKIVLISNCGFPETHHFSALVETFKRFTDNPDMELTATILCAGGELLSQPALSESLSWYLDAARKAGSEVVNHGRILPETQRILDTPLADPEAYANMANLWWDSQIPRGEKAPPEGFFEEISPPISPPAGEAVAPKSCREAILGMPRVFNPSAAAGLHADIQFHVTGEEPGEYVLRIRNGVCTAHEGVVSNPTLTIYTPSEVWLKIARGELSGQTAYLKNMYRVEGDFSLLLKLGDLFSGPGRTVSPAPSTTEPVSQGPIRMPGMAWLTVAFLPWIINWAFFSLNPFLSTGFSLLAGALLWAYRLLFEKPTWMETGTLAYFAACLLLTLSGNEFLETHGDVIGYIALAGIWLGTLAAEKPLTAEYSKWHYPSALWTHPVFLRTNAIITTAWGWVYLVQAVLALAGHFYREWMLTLIVARNLLLIPAFVFTAWFQKWYPAYGSLKRRSLG